MRSENRCEHDTDTSLFLGSAQSININDQIGPTLPNPVDRHRAFIVSVSCPTTWLPHSRRDQRLFTHISIQLEIPERQNFRTHAHTHARTRYPTTNMSLNHLRHVTPTTTPSTAVAAACKPTQIDYRKLMANGIGDSDGATSAASALTSTAHQLAPRFLVECSVKLHMKPLTSATASVLYYRFFRAASSDDYDAFLIASSCLYLAGKVKDDPVKIRDVINVSHATLNRDATPLELGEEYWTLRDSIVQAELLITRMLKFDLGVVHPHKVGHPTRYWSERCSPAFCMNTHALSLLLVYQYLLHFMATLQEWFGKDTWTSMPIARIAAGFLQDFHSHPAILDYKPAHVACGCLSLAFQTYGVQVPVTDEFDENLVWYNVSVRSSSGAGGIGETWNLIEYDCHAQQVFAKDLTKELHWELLEKIMDVYNNEQQHK